MPLRSQAQRRWMHAAEARGELPKGTAARWEAHTPKDKPLPEHVAEKSAAFWLGYKLAAAFAQPFAASNTMSSYGTGAKTLGPPKPPTAANTASKPLQYGGGGGVKPLPPQPGARDAQASFVQGIGSKALESGDHLDDGASMPVTR